MQPASNVIAFRTRRAQVQSRHPKSILEAVYGAGSLAIPADDVLTKTAAIMLQALGFLTIDEILADGSACPLTRKEARKAMGRPWRLSKPAFSGEAGMPDAYGAFAQPS